MTDILNRLLNSSPNESSHELFCRCLDAAEAFAEMKIEVERLRVTLRDIHDNPDGARVKAAAALDGTNPR